HVDIAVHQREIVDLGVGDRQAERRDGGFDDGRITFHLYRLRDRADLQYGVDARVAIHVEDDSRLLELLEPVGINGDLVSSYRQEQNREGTIRDRGDIAGDVGFEVSRGDFRAGNRGAGAVGDGTRNGSGGGLAECGGRKQGNANQNTEFHLRTPKAANVCKDFKTRRFGSQRWLWLAMNRPPVRAVVPRRKSLPLHSSPRTHRLRRWGWGRRRLHWLLRTPVELHSDEILAGLVVFRRPRLAFDFGELLRRDLLHQRQILL